MKIWEDKDKRKGLITTVSVHVVLLLLFIFFGLGYTEPKERAGIPINFGDSFTGGGEQYQESASVPEPVDAAPSDVPDVVTQDVVDAAAINTQEDPIKEPTTKPKDTKETKPIEEKKDPKPSDDLQNLLNDFNTNPSGEGDGKGNTNQGTQDGVEGSNGQGGSGGGDGYDLAGRSPRSKPKPTYDCGNEAGVVRVKVWVNRQGKVVRAEYELKGSTTSNTCLVNSAKAAALKTTWSGDNNARQEQVGHITYSLGRK